MRRRSFLQLDGTSEDFAWSEGKGGARCFYGSAICDIRLGPLPTSSFCARNCSAYHPSSEQTKYFQDALPILAYLVQETVLRGRQ